MKFYVRSDQHQFTLYKRHGEKETTLGYYSTLEGLTRGVKRHAALSKAKKGLPVEEFLQALQRLQRLEVHHV